MPQYLFEASRDVIVTETYQIELEADTQEEARDVVHEVLAEHPNSSLAVSRLVRIGQEYGEILPVVINKERLLDDEDSGDAA